MVRVSTSRTLSPNVHLVRVLLQRHYHPKAHFVRFASLRTLKSPQDLFSPHGSLQPPLRHMIAAWLCHVTANNPITNMHVTYQHTADTKSY